MNVIDPCLVRTRSLADRTQPNFGGKPRQWTAVKHFGPSTPQKIWGPKLPIFDDIVKDIVKSVETPERIFTKP